MTSPLGPGSNARSWRDVPHHVAAGVGIVRRAAPGYLAAVVALELLSGVGIAGEVVIGRDALAAILATQHTNAGLGHVWPSVLALAGVTAMLGAAGIVLRELSRLMSERTARYALGRILDVTCAVDLAAFDDPAFHDRLARAQAGVTRAPQMVFGLQGLGRALSGAVGGVIALLTVAPLVAPMALLALFPGWAASGRRGRAFFRFGTFMTPQDRERDYLAGLLTRRETASEVRAFGLTDFLRARHDRLYDARIAELQRVSRRAMGGMLTADVLGALIVAGSIAVVLWLAVSHQMGLPAAVTSAGALVFLGERFASAGQSSGMLQESALFFGDFVGFLEGAAPRAHTSAVAPPSRPHVRSIVADNVTFRYPGLDRLAVRDVSIHIDAGEVVALVGPNGSGKSTLAKLLAGLYLPAEGRVSWNGQYTDELDRLVSQEQTAIVFQDFVRYILPAYDNIALGRYEHHGDADAVTEAAVRSGAHRDLSSLPFGYDTLLGPTFFGGTDLSTGQWQRVALARAFFRNAPFVILDEPTASLDASAEHELFAGIHELLVGRSVLLISHRFSTVRNADRIYVMDAGQVVESGTHEELMDAGDRYAELFMLQAAPYR